MPTSESTLRDFLLYDPLNRFDRQTSLFKVLERFSSFLPKDPSPQVIGALLPFAAEIPWNCWDDSTVWTALNILEENQARTLEAFNLRRSAVDRGIDSLFRKSPVLAFEDSLNHSQSFGLVHLATQFFPEYLRWAEHIFGNLVEIYWSLKKRGGVSGKFDINGGLALLNSKGLQSLLKGFDDSVRNAIAHGETAFTGFDSEFGIVKPTKYLISDFLRLFDELCRTCNALCLGLLLFWARNGSTYQGNLAPLSVLLRFAAGGINRTGIHVLGAVESNTPLAGKQLHISVFMAMKARTQVLYTCSRIATNFIEAGISDYDRFVFEIDHGDKVGSMSILLPSKLSNLVSANASLDLLPEVFPETQLLWFDESRWKTRLKMWNIIVSSGIPCLRLEILKNWRAQGLWIGKGRYRIREIENLSSQGIARVRIRAVLNNPSDANNLPLVKEILYELVKTGRSKFVRSRSQFLNEGIRWPRKPQYVFVDLFKVDGTLRWLKGGGWLAGNLVAVAERVWGNHPSVLVENPEQIYKGIRIRFSMDTKSYQESVRKLVNLMGEIWAKHNIN